MNVFEDLIEELRDENLIEETVIDLKIAAVANGSNGHHSANGHSLEAAVSPMSNGADRDTDDFETPSADDENAGDFYRKRAMEEVSGLQMVEHVLSGIEGGHRKAVTAGFDDLQVKKALHWYLQVTSDPTSGDYAEAEFELMHKTEGWNSALAARDEKIPVAKLRRFCENSRPPLSSQALIALARFYRNAPYSDVTRSKFDFVMTRLFSRETDTGKRRLLFGRSEMIGHIRTFYASWSSLALYSADDAALKTRATVAGFEDRIAEAESALTFDQLIQNDFFNKVHEFKTATGEIFFTPEIVAATIECNTKIGNKFVDLIRLERERATPESIEAKYGVEYDQMISEAAGKTIALGTLVKTLPELSAESADDSIAPASVKPKPVTKAVKKEKRQLISFDLFGVNKWLLVSAILIVLSSVGLYFWSNQSTAETSSAEQASDISVENTELKEYVRAGRATSETFYAITLPSWDQLTDDQKKDLLRKALEFANANGQKNVQLLNVRGRSVGYATKKRIEVQNP